MTSLLFLVTLAILVGALGGVHIPINGALGLKIGSPVVATITFYTVALAVISAVALFTTERSQFLALREVPVWYFVLPGLISAVVVGTNTFLIPRLGALNVFVIALATQSVVRAVISHYGLLGSPVDPINAAKIAGASLVAVGAFLVVRN